MKRVVGLGALAVLMLAANGCAKKSTELVSVDIPIYVGEGADPDQLARVHFGFDEAMLSDQAQANLAKNADILRARDGVKIRIEGHADERGENVYNLALGERRAQAVREYLVKLGVDPKRVEIISLGEEKPAVPGADEAAFAQNRRAESMVVEGAEDVKSSSMQ